MGGTYREQIVKSEAQRLARERERYWRVWSRFQWVEWMPKAVMVGAGLLGLVIPIAGLLAARNIFVLAGTLCAPFAVLPPLIFATTIVAVARRNLLRCPRCGLHFSLKLRWHDLYIATGGDQCRHCGLPRGYLPTAEDLERDEPEPE